MTTMTTNERKLIKFFREADEDGKMYILQMLTCFLVFGDDFITEMKELIDKSDKNGMKECVARWYARGCEEFGAERMTL